MERKEPLNNFPDRSHRFSWVLLMLIFSGFLMSAVFIFLTLSRPYSHSSEVAVAVPASSTIAAPTAIPSTSTFITLPLSDPKPGDVPEIGSLRIGQSAPDFTLATLDGGKVILDSLRGQAVLISFWASWCQPCRLEAPDLVTTYKAYKSSGFVILGINLTSEDQLPDIKAFVKEFKLTFPILLDVDDNAKTLYGLLGLPMNVFVNRAGIVTRIFTGTMSRDQINESVGEISQPSN